MTYRILLLHSHRTNNGIFQVGVSSNNWGIPDNWSVRDLKLWCANNYQIPIEEQRWFTQHITLEDNVKLKSLGVTDLSLIITNLSGSFLLTKLPHMSLSGRQALLTHLQSIPISQLDVMSVRENPVNATTTNQTVTIRNYTLNMFVREIVIDGEEFIPLQLDDETKKVRFQSRYPYRYSAASDEYVKEVKEANEKYESDLAHCKRLLRELPIALANSRQKLVEDTKAVYEKASGIELSDLGALSVEQVFISAELNRQQERLSQLKPTEFDQSKFTIFEFESEINLSFGWHKFDGTIYELTYTPVPTESEINSLLQPNQYPVLVKRSGQQSLAEVIRPDEPLYENQSPRSVVTPHYQRGHVDHVGFLSPRRLTSLVFNFISTVSANVIDHTLEFAWLDFNPTP